MTQIQPILPEEVQGKKNSTIPDDIIDAVNELIVKEWNGSQSHILQKDIVQLAIYKDPDLTSTIIFDNRWMNFETIFQAVGWNVSYDKPGYNESYEASFKFTKSK